MLILVTSLKGASAALAWSDFDALSCQKLSHAKYQPSLPRVVALFSHVLHTILFRVHRP